MNEWLEVIHQRKHNISKKEVDDNLTNNDYIAATVENNKDNHTNEGLFFNCPKCCNVLMINKLKENDLVCYKCNYHLRMNSEERLKSIFDQDSIEFFDMNLISCDPLNFPNYKNKLETALKKLDINEGVITGQAKIHGEITCFGIMDFRFIMGTMGSVVGERLTRMVEKASEDNKPVVIFASSGGARVQEGMLALSQMAKVLAAIEKHNQKGNLFISILTDPTMGGVTASFASVADIIIAEPNATIGFAGKRVIEETVKERLEDDFQTSEFMFKNGMIDIICDRKTLKNCISSLIHLHNANKQNIFLNNKTVKHFSESLSINKKNFKITSWDKVKIARDINRPNYNEYISGIIDNFVEMHGDRSFRDDSAIVTGIGYLFGIAVTVISSAKGKTLSENIYRNFGMAHPEGYRKVQRIIKHAEKFNMPIICFVDTPGAYCGVDAEKRGQGEAIANCIKKFTNISVPVISVITGEGGSGGALAMTVADYIFMLENSIYSVISPEGCASILFGDASKAQEASEYLKLTAEELLKLKIIDEIVYEPKAGTQIDVEKMISLLKNKIYNKLIELICINKNKLLHDRYTKLRQHGWFICSNKEDVLMDI